MEGIKQRLSFYFILLVTSFVFLITFYARMIEHSKISIVIVFAIFLLVFLIVFTLFLSEYRNYRYALLIVENKIFDIQAAVDDCFSNNSIEFIISCFGILVGTKIIRFNVEGIQLKEVVISNKVISITYEKDNKRRNIKLLHGIAEKAKVKEISEKFQFETGINPFILD